jgi:hypothetical protein
VPVEEEKPAVVEEPVKVIQKPYVLIGAGTASFAAAQAIKEKDPNANVTIESDILCVYSTVCSIRSSSLAKKAMLLT